MTYEQFKRGISEEVDTKESDIRKFIIHYAIMLFIGAFCLSFLISRVVGSLFGVAFMVLVLFLFIFSLDVFVESPSIYQGCCKVTKHWLLYSIIIVISSIVIRVFLL